MSIQSPSIAKGMVWCEVGRDAVRVAGPDAETYLQGQCAQDVAAVGVGTSAWTFLLQPSGKVDVLARVTRLADGFVLDTDGGYGEALAERLRRFLLRTKATVEPLAWRGIAVRNPGPRLVTMGAAVIARAVLQRTSPVRGEIREHEDLAADRIHRREDAAERAERALLRRRPVAHVDAVGHVEPGEADGARRGARERGRHRVEKRQGDRGADPLQDHPPRKRFAGDDHWPLASCAGGLRSPRRCWNGTLATIPWTSA